MRIRLVIILLFCAPMATNAQFIFQNLRWQDGLSAKEVRCLYKDDDGYLWIGTSNGLNRFDGAVIRQFKNTKYLNSLYINAIHPLTGTDSLLVGTRTGIRIFNKNTGVFLADKRFAALNNEIISGIKPDPDNRLWISTGTGIFVFDNGKLLPIADYIPAAKIMQKQGYTIAAFVWDKIKKGFWVGSTEPYFIDCDKKQVYNKSNNPFHYPLLDSAGVYSIALDNKDNIWFSCNFRPSLNYWDRRSNKIESYTELDGKKMSSGPPNRLFVDSKDRVWISTWLFAAFLKEPGKPIKKIPFSQSQTYSISYGFFRDAIEDAEGNVWLGTINGVSKSQSHDPFQAIYQLPSFNFFLETGFAHANYVGIDSNMIMACKEEGIVAYNTSERTYKRYIVSSTELQRNRFVMAAKTGTTWWFAGDDGVYYLEEGSESLKHFDQVKANPETNAVSFIFTDPNGNIWFEPVHDALYRYNPVTKRTDRFDGTDPAHGLFNFKAFTTFTILKNNDLLFAVRNEGFLRFNVSTEQFSYIPVPIKNEFSVIEMAEDHKGNIWAAIGGRGIIKIDRQGKFVDSINTSSGLIIDYITSLEIDGRGFIWAGCREGLMYINPDTKDLTKVDIDLGQTLQDYWNSINIYNGKVYAVMLDHVVVIDPFLFEAVTVKSSPNITSIRIFGDEITREIKDNALTLSANEDYITFQFASLHHREVPSLQYSYQLIGVDKNWVNCGRNLTISYNNLLPGTYTFNIRSTDEHGKWMEKITSLKVVVNPHWWQTWWFTLLCCLGGVVLLFKIYKNTLRRRQRKNIDRTIDYFANSVYGENSVNEICWDIARNCISQLQFEDCVVYLLDEEKQVLVQKAAYGPKNPKGHEIIDPIEIPKGHGIVGNVWASGKAQLIHDTTKDARYIVDDEKRNSEISVPIFHDGKVIGVIDSEHSQKGFFTESHLKALTTIASISANKIAEANAEEVAKQNEIKLLEINKMLAESQLMALRAQMNPHFVFNCLNSIQECIVTQKYGEASKYLNKFSKLFRSVLNNSGKKLVSIDEEIEVLELYLELEQMRFEQSFTYEMIIDEELEMDEVLLPSMLLQPYVENALWHGLMHKEGKREMKIEFKRVNDEVFRCTIDDNGIGRKMSYELKDQQSKAKRHESKGLKISKDRLTLLGLQGYHASIHIIDKYDDAGNIALGTTVVIELSTFLKNI
jgi:ligand-binding sensor domain-containing protein/putative methionine-R-sulfoxide reductase with GAF domain